MRIKFIAISVVFLVFSLGNAFGAIMSEVNTVSDYLMVTDEQQRIYVGRYLAANENIAKECLKDSSIENTTTRFNKWLEDRPQYLRRNLTSAFTAALLAACK